MYIIGLYTLCEDVEQLVGSLIMGVSSSVRHSASCKFDMQEIFAST